MGIFTSITVNSNKRNTKFGMIIQWSARSKTFSSPSSNNLDPVRGVSIHNLSVWWGTSLLRRGGKSIPNSVNLFFQRKVWSRIVLTYKLLHFLPLAFLSWFKALTIVEHESRIYIWRIFRVNICSARSTTGSIDILFCARTPTRRYESGLNAYIFIQAKDVVDEGRFPDTRLAKCKLNK